MKTFCFIWFTCVFSVVAGQDNSEPALLLNENFEREGLYANEWWNRSGNDKAYLQSDISREGNGAARFLADLNDKGDFRSEIAVAANNPSPRHYELGAEYWYGFSIHPDSGMAISPISEIVFQFHSTPDNVPGETWQSGLNPPIALSCNGERWYLVIRGDDKPVTRKPDYLFQTNADLGQAELGKWTDWVFNIKWNYDGNGFVKIWKNGKMVYYLEGPNTYHDHKGPYLKLGVYAFYLRRPGSDSWQKAKEAGVNQRIYYHDALRIADSRGDCNLVSPVGRTCEPENAALKINWKTIETKRHEKN